MYEFTPRDSLQFLGKGKGLPDGGIAGMSDVHLVQHLADSLSVKRYFHTL